MKKCKHDIHWNNEYEQVCIKCGYNASAKALRDSILENLKEDFKRDELDELSSAYHYIDKKIFKWIKYLYL